MGAAARTQARVEGIQRLRIDVSGAVQGVGFRPFVHRLATDEGLAGYVCNTASGACLEIEGSAAAVDRFLARLDAELSSPAAITGQVRALLAPLHQSGFAIRDSVEAGPVRARVLPDIVTCPACLHEILDPTDRRYLYPFTTCTQCGPRYTIIEALPYDRERTSMRHFPKCSACAAEYDDPRSRRFHAETNACPHCGPSVELLDPSGGVIARFNEAIARAAQIVRQGGIVGIKGIGGFQLVADARNQVVVARLRQGKRRPGKPLAVMVGSLRQARELAVIPSAAEEILVSSAGPIVLVEAIPGTELAADVAPRSPLVGLLLPTSPLHHILLRQLDFPVIVTSGNRTGEPLATSATIAIEQLGGFTDAFLSHDRPIVRPADDSVVRVIAGSGTVLRNGRGHAPLTLETSLGRPADGMALGGQQKSAVALLRDGQVILGPHVGDLDSVATRRAFDRATLDFPALHGVEPKWLACDQHPDFYSKRHAGRAGLPIAEVPHHVAHILAAMADNAIDGEVLGIAWDGSGYGDDATVWGGEFLAVDGTAVRRVAHLLPFRLPGGETAVREPRRSAVGVLHVLGQVPDTTEWSAPERDILHQMLDRGINSPLTSSAGRLFDAVASLLGLCQVATFEGEAAMAVEFAVGRATAKSHLTPIALSGEGTIVLDWRPTLRDLLAAHRSGTPAEDLAAAFHHALCNAMVAVAGRAGINRIVLTGGCFQNARLSETALAALEAAGFTLYRHRRVPPNDGGLAVGQAMWAARRLIEEVA